MLKDRIIEMMNKGKNFIGNRKKEIIVGALGLSLVGGVVYGMNLLNSNEKEMAKVDSKVESSITTNSSVVGTSDSSVVATTNNTVNTSNDTVVAMGGEEVKVEEKVVSGGNEVKTNTGTKTENKVENTVSSNTNSSKAENVSVSNNNSSSKPNNTVSSKPSNNTSSNNSSTSKPSNNTSSKPITPAHTHTWKDETKVVHHDEEGYWDTVVVKEAWVEEVPKYKTEVRAICNTCNEDITGTNIPLHVKEHMLAGNDKGGHREEVRQVQVGVDKINHPAVTEKRWVVSRPAWDETVVVGSICSGCGAKK